MLCSEDLCDLVSSHMLCSEDLCDLVSDHTLCTADLFEGPAPDQPFHVGLLQQCEHWGNITVFSSFDGVTELSVVHQSSDATYSTTAVLLVQASKSQSRSAIHCVGTCDMRLCGNAACNSPGLNTNVRKSPLSPL